MSSSTPGVEPMLGVAVQAAVKAGQIIRHFATELHPQFKSRHNLVTAADLESERVILSTIKEHFPDHAFLSEESHPEVSDNPDSLWVIDPLDGTNNFCQGLPHFAVSIAYVEKGRVQCGVIYDPSREECYTAIRGRGAWLGGKRIQVSATPVLAEAIIATGFYYDRGAMMEATLQSMQQLFHTGIRGIRRLGAAALDLAWVSCGRLDGYFEYQLSPWDFAAGTLLVIEAGGQVGVDPMDPLPLFRHGMIASNGSFHRDFCEKVQWSKFAAQSLSENGSNS